MFHQLDVSQLTYKLHTFIPHIMDIKHKFVVKQHVTSTLHHQLSMFCNEFNFNMYTAFARFIDDF